METKIHVALCALVILSLSWNVEGQDPLVIPFSPSDGPLTLGIPGVAQTPLAGGSPSPPGSLSIPSTDYPKPASELTDGRLSNNNNNSSSNDIEVVVVDPSMGAPPPIQEENEVPAPPHPKLGRHPSVRHTTPVPPDP